MPELFNANGYLHKAYQKLKAALRDTSSMQVAMMTKTAVSETSKADIKRFA